MGTINVLQGLRRLKDPCAAVIVTTDKVYGGPSSIHRESHALGANEPYGASKAAVELAVQAWREAFGMPMLATVRAGNVIGGGDWAQDRLLPDCIRALSKGRTIAVRNPTAVRPWQHVLDPLHGYLILAALLRNSKGDRRRAEANQFETSFNFGPSPSDHRTVRDLVCEILRHWPGEWAKVTEKNAPPETEILRLDAGKAHRVLGWRPRWHFNEAVSQSVAWYRGLGRSGDALEITQRQVAEFSEGLL